MSQPANPIQFYPAYGRIYKTKADFQHDWDSNKDFQLPNGQYFSIRDLTQLSKQHDTVYITLRRKPVYVVRFGNLV